MTYIVGANTTDTYTAAQMAQGGKGFGLGDRFTDNSGNEWVFVQATTALAQYDVANVSAAYAAAPITTTIGLRGNIVGVAPVAFAVNDYGWVQVKGTATANVLASCAANVRLNTTATAGSPDDDGTSTTKQIQGIYLTAARAASNGPAAAILLYPFVDVTI